MFEQHTLVGPTNHVIGGEQPHLAALFYGGDTEGHVPLVAGLPDLRVAVVVVDLIERAIDDHAALGGAGQLVVVWFGDHLHLPVAAGVVLAVGPTVAGVVELELAVIADHCGTGEHAVFFLFEIGANMIGSRFQLSMSVDETWPSASDPTGCRTGAAGRTRANGPCRSTGRSDR